jgi:hypothetical protein
MNLTFLGHIPIRQQSPSTESGGLSKVC